MIDHETFISGRGALLEIIKSGMEIPPGTLIFEDPPIHNIHRNLLSRMFTPRKVHALEPQIREFTARCLDPLVGTGRFDFVNDLGEQMPMRVIGMLLGIPEEHQRRVADHGEATLQSEQVDLLATGEVFAEFIDYRTEHPSDDIMTDLLNVEFDDETGTVRRLRRDELLMYLTVVADGGRRDHHPADRLGRQDAGRTPRSASRARGEPRPDPTGGRGDPALGAAGTADRPLRRPRHRVLRPDGARRQRDADADRCRQPRPPPLPARTAMFSTSTESSTRT